MAEIEDNIRRSDAFQEMMGKTPAWIIRTGSVLMVIWMFLLFALSIWIHYPDILEGTIDITTETPPAELVAKASGRINLLVVNDQLVKKDQVIAYIKNPASFEEITVLSQAMNRLQRIASDPSLMLSILDTVPHLTHLGKVQNAYNVFISNLDKYEMTYRLDKNEAILEHDKEQIETFTKKQTLLREREKLLLEELELIEENYRKDKSLFERKLISQADYDLSKSNYLLTKRNVNESSLRNTEQNKLLRIDISNAFTILISDLAAYKDEFFVTSPVEGSVSFFDFWNNNQYIQSGDKVAYVVVDSKQIVGKLTVLGNKFGKVKVGQKVRVKLNSYPMSEFGMLLGKVSKISKVNRDNTYRVDVVMNQPLITTYNINIPYSNEMRGIGEIVTGDMTLLQRIFYQLRALGEREYASSDGEHVGIDNSKAKK